MPVLKILYKKIKWNEIVASLPHIQSQSPQETFKLNRIDKLPLHYI